MNKYIYVYEINKASKIISKRWKDRTARQEIYSGSATRTSSLPYSTPRAPNSRVFFTISTSSLMAEKTVHTNLHTTFHTTTSSHLSHTFYTTSSNQSTSQLTTPRLISSHQFTSQLTTPHLACSLQSNS